jgi:hypothetical protein
VAGQPRADAQAKRPDLQHSALTNPKLLGYMALMADEQGAILPKQ